MSTADKNYILSQMANIVTSDANGVITGLNTSSYTANLGPVGNVTITGGSNGQVLTTDGSGVLNWSTVSTNNVANANYAAYAGNVTIAAQSNITNVGTLTGLTSNGTINFTGASNVALGAIGNVTVTGGSNGQVLTTNGSGGLSWTTQTGGSSAAQTGEYRFFTYGAPDSTWLVANATYNTSSYPSLAASFATATVTSTSIGTTGLGVVTAMTFGGTRYILITNIGISRYSSDGVAWTTGGNLPQVGTWNDICWNGSVFFAVAFGTNVNTAATSPDGVTWTTRTLPAGTSNYSYKSCTAAGSTLYALQSTNGGGNNSLLAKSTDNGATWTTTSMPVGTFEFIAYGGGKFITSRYGTSIVYWSTDAVTWNSSTTAATIYAGMGGASYNGTSWYIGDNFSSSTTIGMSYDGVAWTSSGTPNGSSMNARYITWNGARWVVLDAANNTLYWSQGISRLWSSLAVAAGMTGSLRPMTDGTGNSIVIHNANTQVMYKYTFTMATTFTAGIISADQRSATGGQWWIKS